MNERSKQIRRDTIALAKKYGGYHFGGSFSAVEILIALFDHTLTDDDKFILSKGHGCWPYYVLLREKGFNPKLEGHPVRDEANGVYCTTGSLGHGLPTAVGMAMAKKLEGKPGKIYVLIGDGECQEGTTWESILIAAQHKLKNLVVIIDYNRIQGSDFIENILQVKGIGKVAEIIGWHISDVDGHSLGNIRDYLMAPTGPRLIIAHTVKGKGVKFMENRPSWHAKFPDREQLKVALEGLE